MCCAQHGCEHEAALQMQVAVHPIINLYRCIGGNAGHSRCDVQTCTLQSFAPLQPSAHGGRVQEFAAPLCCAATSAALLERCPLETGAADPPSGADCRGDSLRPFCMGCWKTARPSCVASAQQCQNRCLVQDHIINTSSSDLRNIRQALASQVSSMRQPAQGCTRMRRSSAATCSKVGRCCGSAAQQASSRLCSGAGRPGGGRGRSPSPTTAAASSCLQRSTVFNQSDGIAPCRWSGDI